MFSTEIKAQKTSRITKIAAEKKSRIFICNNPNKTPEGTGCNIYKNKDYTLMD